MLRTVTAHAARTVGTSTQAWAVAAHLIPDFTGTLPQLLTAAAAAAA